MQRNYFQALSAARHSLSLPLIFPRRTENFCMVTCINLAVVWVPLSLIAMSKCCVGVRIVRVSFNLDYAVENRLTPNVQDICHLRYFVR